MERSSPSELLLLAGVLAGALLATTGLLEPATANHSNAAAVVNGAVISKSDYLSYLDLMARDKRNPMTDEDRRHVLNRLIEEKLLIERALAIGLPAADSRVRKTIVNAMIQTAANEADMSAPSSGDISDFYSVNLAYFSSPTRISVRRMVFRGDDALDRANAAHEKLAGGGRVRVCRPGHPCTAFQPATDFQIARLHRTNQDRGSGRSDPWQLHATTGGTGRIHASVVAGLTVQ